MGFSWRSQLFPDGTLYNIGWHQWQFESRQNSLVAWPLLSPKLPFYLGIMPHVHFSDIKPNIKCIRQRGRREFDWILKFFKALSCGRQAVKKSLPFFPRHRTG